jgi:hypothetical protein
MLHPSLIVLENLPGVNTMQSNIPKRKAPTSTLRTNLLLDIGLLVFFLFAYEPRATGIGLHEWLGVAIGSVLLVHLLLHWEWIAAVTRRFSGKTSRQARVNYVLNLTLFIAFTGTLFSGLMISESLLPLVGLAAVGGGFWHWLHGFAADLTFWLAAVHIALHWKTLANMLQKYIGAGVTSARPEATRTEHSLSSGSGSTGTRY